MDIATDRRRVTIFGDVGAVTEAVGEEIRRHGAATHVVSVPTGWPRTADRVVLCLDSAPGRVAARQLAEHRVDPLHVVAVHEGPAGPVLDAWADEVRDHHEVVVLRVDPEHVDDLAERVADVVVGDWRHETS